MGRFGAALALVVIGVVSAFAAEITTRKAGLWEMKTTTSEGNSVSMQQCTDAQTDQAMQAGVGSASQRVVRSATCRSQAPRPRSIRCV